MTLMRPGFTRNLILLATLLILAAPAAAQQSQTAKSAKKGAGWGALAGLVFGGSLWDVAEGAAIGAAGGAGYGALKSNEQSNAQPGDPGHWDAMLWPNPESS